MCYLHGVESFSEEIVERITEERDERVSLVAQGQYPLGLESDFSEETYDYYSSVVTFKSSEKTTVNILNRRRESVGDWAGQAICRGMTRMFFDDPSIKLGEQLKQIARAKAICHGCPVEQECGEYAIANQEPAGIWGGMDEEERRRQINRRRLS